MAICCVGANPLYVIYALGGAHNDLMMLLLMMAAVSLTFAGRDAARRRPWWSRGRWSRPPSRRCCRS